MTTHRMSNRHGTIEWRTYRAWQMMKNRCLNSKSPDYPRYGGAGVTVWPAWRTFEQFLADVGLAPTTQHTIDRIRSAEGYKPGNVRWATRGEQQRNLKSNRRIKIDTRDLTHAEWARYFGLSRQAFHLRVGKIGALPAIAYYQHKTGLL